MKAKPYLKEISFKRNDVADFEQYPFTIAAVRNLDVLAFHPDVTFLVGENGTGKSTLVEAIALLMGFSSEGGTRNVRFSTAETVSELHKYLKPVKSYKRPEDHYFLRAESFFNVATYMDQLGFLDGGYGEGKSLHQRSHGEAFMALLTHKLRGRGFYIFDEPEAALSPTRQLAALSAIHHLVEDESQFIIATHSPILLAYPRSKILLLNESGITEVKYEETEHYSVTRYFLNHHPKMIDALLKKTTD